MSAADVLNAALDELTADQRRDATNIMLGYLWTGADAETRKAALAAAMRIVR